MRILSEPTRSVTLYVAGDFAAARQACREFCMDGLCVTVTPTTFVYTGGAEDGVSVGLVNYLRFPSSHEELADTAARLGEFLLGRLCQHSFLVVQPDRTVWHSRREDKE